MCVCVVCVWGVAGVSPDYKMTHGDGTGLSHTPLCADLMSGVDREKKKTPVKFCGGVISPGGQVDGWVVGGGAWHLPVLPFYASAGAPSTPLLPQEYKPSPAGGVGAENTHLQEHHRVCVRPEGVERTDDG